MLSSFRYQKTTPIGRVIDTIVALNRFYQGCKKKRLKSDFQSKFLLTTRLSMEYFLTCEHSNKRLISKMQTRLSCLPEGVKSHVGRNNIPQCKGHAKHYGWKWAFKLGSDTNIPKFGLNIFREILENSSNYL